MTLLTSIVTIQSGTPQFRIRESMDAEAPAYYFYSQTDLEEDLCGMTEPGSGVRESGSGMSDSGNGAPGPGKGAPRSGNGMSRPGGATPVASERKCVKTFDAVSTVSSGDVVLSLLSGTAAIVAPQHDGYLFTQNYVVLDPSAAVDAAYLVYIINENRQVRQRLRRGMQGSATMKYTLKQLNSLELPTLPPLERQVLIGEAYLSQLKLAALKKRVADLETKLLLATIEEVG